MASQLRAYRSRMRSVQATKQITRAMELIASSRIIKAQQRSRAAAPYARAITRAVSALYTFSNTDHPLTVERAEIRRSAVLIITSDRGLAGGYSSSVIRESERLLTALREDGKEPVPYLSGRKVMAFYSFRNRDHEKSWSGKSDEPEFETAREMGQALVDAFIAGGDNGGVDEIFIVYSRFFSMVTQAPEVIRLLPVEVVDDVADLSGSPESAAGPATTRDDVRGAGPLPLYEFEPSPEAVLDALMPQYIQSRVYSCLLSAAASELASRQRAMKSATDNAEELIRTLRRQANAARQGEITQEITEIVGGADALAASTSSD